MMRLSMKVQKYPQFIIFALMLDKLFPLFFPRACAVCGKSLIPAEKIVCLPCLSDLPRSGY